MRYKLGRFRRPHAGNATPLLATMSDPGDQPIGVNGFAGSSRAQVLFKDTDADRDSLDVITIGDSNTGFVETTGWGYGYHTGIYKAFSLRATEYSSPLMPAMLGTTGSAGHSGNMFGIGLQPLWSADKDAGASGSVGPIRSLVVASSIPDANAQAVTSYLGMDTTNLPASFGYTWQSSFVAGGNTYTNSGANKQVIVVNTTAQLYSSGASMQYRVMFARVNAAGGQFKLGMWSNFSATFSAYKSTNSGGGTDVTTETYNFTAPALAYRCGWDGIAQGTSNHVVGPAPVLAHSIARLNVKGFAFNNLMYDSGKTTAQIADRVEQMDRLLDEYLREMRNRQIACGGSGNVVVKVFSGINGTETPTSYVNNAQRIVNRISARWFAIGGNTTKLAFVFVPTHPIVNNINGWNTSRTAIVNAANSWAATQPGVCVFDINAYYTASAINTNGWYSTATTQAHLKEAGYDAVGTALITNILA